MKFTLTAQLGAEKDEREFEARDTLEATIEAVSIVLNSAYGHREPWTSGRVLLRDEKNRIIHEMPPHSK